MGLLILSELLCGNRSSYATAHSSYSQGIHDGWLACPSPNLLAKSTKYLGHPILSLHTPAVVKVFWMDGWLACPSPHLLPKSTLLCSSGKVSMVDYEYGGPNPAAYDIGNHFCEFAGPLLFFNSL